MGRITRASLFGIMVGAAVPPAFANVTFYDAFKTADYSQELPDAPETPYGYRFDARVFTNVDDEAIYAKIYMPGGSPTLFLIPAGRQLTTYRDAALPQSLPDLDAIYPAGVYTYEITAGDLAGQTASLPMGDSMYPDTVPYFTGDSYTRLAQCVAGQDLTLSFNGCGRPDQADFSLTFFSVFDETTRQYVYTNYGDSGAYASDTVPGNLLLPHHALRFGVTFSNRYEGAGDFAGSTYVAGFDFATTASGVALPSWGLIPGDANDDQRIDADDYALIDRGFAGHLSGWSNGDFNGDGVVDEQDYLIIDEAFAANGPLSPAFLADRQSQFGGDYVAALLASVPEPSSALAGLGTLVIVRRYRRRA